MCNGAKPRWFAESRSSGGSSPMKSQSVQQAPASTADLRDPFPFSSTVFHPEQNPFWCKKQPRKK